MTHAQRRILNWLDSGPATAAQITNDLARTGMTNNAVRCSLRNMERRGWVQRPYIPGEQTRWELTVAGREARDNSAA